jgi:hypothetical protein
MSSHRKKQKKIVRPAQQPDCRSSRFQSCFQHGACRELKVSSLKKKPLCIQEKEQTLIEQVEFRKDRSKTSGAEPHLRSDEAVYRKDSQGKTRAGKSGRDSFKAGTINGKLFMTSDRFRKIGRRFLILY